MNSFHQGELRDSKWFECWTWWPDLLRCCLAAALLTVPPIQRLGASLCDAHSTLLARHDVGDFPRFSSGLVQTFRIFQTWLTMRSGRFGSDCDWRRFSAAVFKPVHMVPNENVRFSDFVFSFVYFVFPILTLHVLKISCPKQTKLNSQQWIPKCMAWSCGISTSNRRQVGQRLPEG